MQIWDVDNQMFLSSDFSGILIGAHENKYFVIFVRC